MGGKMSGSSSSSWGESGPVRPDSCSTLQIRTQLGSPKPDVVALISVGDILDIAIQQNGTVAVVAALYKGQLAGGIAAPEIARLRECIESGTTYQAEVTSISGGQVRIRIFAA